MNAETPAGANGRGFVKASVSQADALHLAHQAPAYQTHHIRTRYGISAATAAAVAELAFARVDTWRGAR